MASDAGAVTVPDAHNVFRSVCVYCGHRSGKRNAYTEAAVLLGKEMVQRKLKLVYGGGNMGLMGAIAREVISGGGAVLGIIPSALRPREISGDAVGEVREVSDMHERKRLMAESADCFIALPGGFGTLEELIEVGVLNTEGYYSSLLAFFDKAVEEGFVSRDSRKIVVCANEPTELLDKLEAYEASHKTITDPKNWSNTSGTLRA